MIRYATSEDGELSADARAELGALIVSNFPETHAELGTEVCVRWAQQAWRTVPVLFRVVAYVNGGAVAQQSVYRLHAPSGRVIFGLGDMVVAEAYRGRGIARTLVSAALAEAGRRGAEIYCTRTAKLAGLFAELGFCRDAEARRFTDEHGLAVGDLWVWPGEWPAIPAEVLSPADF